MRQVHWFSISKKHLTTMSLSKIIKNHPKSLSTLLKPSVQTLKETRGEILIAFKFKIVVLANSVRKYLNMGSEFSRIKWMLDEYIDEEKRSQFLDIKRRHISKWMLQTYLQIGSMQFSGSTKSVLSYGCNHFSQKHPNRRSIFLDFKKNLII